MENVKQCNFLWLLGRSLDEEIIIRTDSIIEVWKDFATTVTICYMHPDGKRIIEHEETYSSTGDAFQRFFMIMGVIGADWQIDRARELDLKSSLKKGAD